MQKSRLQKKKERGTLERNIKNHNFCSCTVEKWQNFKEQDEIKVADIKFHMEPESISEKFISKSLMPATSQGVAELLKK